jgi:hypothetical protein
VRTGKATTKTRTTADPFGMTTRTTKARTTAKTKADPPPAAKDDTYKAKDDN